MAEPAPRRGWRYWTWRIVRIPLFAYLGVCLVLMFLENWLVYRPTTAAEHWMPAPSPDVKDVWLQTADGVKIHAWWLPRPGSDTAYLYFHGNAGNLSHRGTSIVKLAQFLDTSVLIVDYPGYGKSEGSPSESACYQTADAAYEWLTKTRKIDPDNLVIYGGSLGGGVAVNLASRKPHRALVLAKTFTSLPDAGQAQFPWLPVRWLMRNQFNNMDLIKKCKQPVFLGHGDVDTIIPYEQGQKLFAAANEPKKFMKLGGQDHNDPLPPTFFAELREFLEKMRRGRWG